MNTPVRLAKKEEPIMFNDILKRIKDWAFRHMNIIIPIALIIALALFVVACFAICGVSATGDTIYNGMEHII